MRQRDGGTAVRDGGAAARLREETTAPVLRSNGGGARHDGGMGWTAVPGGMAALRDGGARRTTT
jgi:hypothetical protein